MARLRVRLELNRRNAGVPLDKLASVVEETRRFFHLLAEDVHIDAEHTEWVASDFDPESLNFTAEYSGAVTAEQVRAFGAAFAGATSLRRATISQFTRIADFLGEDELVGFGLFQEDNETEPSEWRCLSKRDAQRFGQEIRLLAEAAGESQPGTSLPAVNGSVAGRRLFKDRREREALAADPMKLIREMETNLTRRIDLLEGQLESQARKMNETRQLAAAPDAADARFHQLLSAMEKFWAQAPRQMPLLAAPTPVEEVAAAPVPEPTPTPVLTPVSEPAPVIEPTSGIEPTSVSEPPPVIEPEPVAKSVSSPAPAAEEIVPVAAPPSAKKPKRWWPAGLAIAAAAVPITFAIPVIQHSWSGYTTVQSMPLVQPKPPAAPALPAIRNPDPEPKAEDSKPANRTIGKPPQRFDGPQIALDIPPNIRSRVPAEARVQVIVAIDNQGNVTRAEVASAKGRGARLLTKEALAAARKSRFRPAHEGDRPVESQMVLTYFVKQDSAEF